MIQTGDPTGTGKGGQSIWGRPFPDEVRGTLKVRSARSPVHLPGRLIRSYECDEKGRCRRRPSVRQADALRLAVQPARHRRHGQLGPRYKQVRLTLFARRSRLVGRAQHNGRLLTLFILQVAVLHHLSAARSLSSARHARSLTPCARTDAKQSHLDTKYSIFGRCAAPAVDRLVLEVSLTLPSSLAQRHRRDGHDARRDGASCSSPSCLSWHSPSTDAARSRAQEKVPVNDKMRPLQPIKIERVRRRSPSCSRLILSDKQVVLCSSMAPPLTRSSPLSCRSRCTPTRSQKSRREARPRLCISPLCVLPLCCNLVDL